MNIIVKDKIGEGGKKGKEKNRYIEEKIYEEKNMLRTK